MFHVFDPMHRRLSITSPEQLQQVIDLAIAGNRYIIFDIGKYIAYNYYMCFNIKESSPEDLKNQLIHKSFEKNHPELF
jgi:hypothetical protein